MGFFLRPNWLNVIMPSETLLKCQKASTSPLKNNFLFDFLGLSKYNSFQHNLPHVQLTPNSLNLGYSLSKQLLPNRMRKACLLHQWTPLARGQAYGACRRRLSHIQSTDKDTALQALSEVPFASW